MAKYVVVEDGKVANIVEADPTFAAEQNWLPVTGRANKGDLVVNGQIVEVLAGDREGAPRVIPVTDLKLLFTAAERIAIYAEIEPLVVDMLRYLDDPRLLEISLDAEFLVDWLNILVGLGILTPARSSAILGGRLP